MMKGHAPHPHLMLRGFIRPVFKPFNSERIAGDTLALLP